MTMKDTQSTSRAPDFRVTVTMQYVRGGKVTQQSYNCESLVRAMELCSSKLALASTRRVELYALLEFWDMRDRSST
jgi:hypothetical protein